MSERESLIEARVENLRKVLKWGGVVATATDEFSYCHDQVRLISGEDRNYTTLVWMDGEAAEALRRLLLDV